MSFTDSLGTGEREEEELVWPARFVCTPRRARSWMEREIGCEFLDLRSVHRSLTDTL